MMSFSASKTFVLSLTLIAFVGWTAADDAQAQRRAARRERGAAAPTSSSESASPAAEPRDVEVVGTSETTPPPNDGAEAPRASAPAAAAAAPSEDESLRRTVQKLSAQITELTRKVNQLEGRSGALVDLERLTRAEQRAEQLHAQLRQVQEKEMSLTARSEQIDVELRPENIARRTELIGSFNPEQVRQQYREQLEREKQQVAAQLQQLVSSRARLETAVATADAYANRLRARVESDDALSREAAERPIEREP